MSFGKTGSTRIGYAQQTGQLFANRERSSVLERNQRTKSGQAHVKALCGHCRRLHKSANASCQRTLGLHCFLNPHRKASRTRSDVSIREWRWQP
uniref:Uncharacterized protein n=1 Tax=Hyaloperonospora arabidopsidis (strain Emoy2) TaxID=559515 RepID=M4B959_HYAAE